MSIGTEATWICPTTADSLLIFLVMTVPVRKPGRHEKHLEHLFTTVYMIHPQPPWYRQIPGPLQDRILVSPTMANSLLICLVMTIHVRKQGRHELDGHVYPYKEAWKATFLRWTCPIYYNWSLHPFLYPNCIQVPIFK